MVSSIAVAISEQAHQSLPAEPMLARDSWESLRLRLLEDPPRCMVLPSLAVCVTTTFLSSTFQSSVHVSVTNVAW